jgi:hypothetical protein
VALDDVHQTIGSDPSSLHHMELITFHKPIPSSTTQESSSSPTFLLSPSEINVSMQTQALAESQRTAMVKMTNITTSLKESETTVKVLMGQLEDLSLRVYESWSDSLKGVEDFVSGVLIDKYVIFLFQISDNYRMILFF